MKSIIAIDPGASGAIAWHNPHIQKSGWSPMPVSRKEHINLFNLVMGFMPVRPVVYVEKVNPFNEGNAHAMFTFGVTAERPVAILEAMGCQIVEVTPQAWQKAMGLGTAERPKPLAMPRGLSATAKKQWKADNAVELALRKKERASAGRDWKNKLKEHAQVLFPQFKVTLANADALLILHYAQQQEGGQLL